MPIPNKMIHSPTLGPMGTQSNADHPEPVHVVKAVDLATFCKLPGLLALNPAQTAQSQADAFLVAYGAAGQPAARAALWWRQAPPLAGECVGCIGYYAAHDRAEDRAGAATLLQAACTRLAATGCTLAIGPLNGSTFRAYRLVTQRSYDDQELPPFFLEVDNPASWPDDFTAAGFATFAEYESSLTLLDGPDPRFLALTAQLMGQGIQLRNMSPAAFEQELSRIYRVVMEAFQPNFLFAPISQAEFMAQYAPLQQVLHPELVFLAERAGEVVGFLVCVPDLAQGQRGEPVDTVVFKTLAVQPTLHGLGVGSLLVAAAHTTAYHLGFRRAIHALMHVDNRSRQISARYAQPFRRYALFARSL